MEHKTHPYLRGGANQVLALAQSKESLMVTLSLSIYKKITAEIIHWNESIGYAQTVKF